MQLLLGTRNRGKIAEIFRILADVPGLELRTVDDVPFTEVAETGESFQANARLKASNVYTETGYPVLTEDAGLEVDALHGAPGIYTARFAGEGASDEANIAKLLDQLADVEDRTARFVCVAVLYAGPDRDEVVAEGNLHGTIAEARRGQSGFGYDPVFIPNGYERTLAELGEDVKAEISHRRRALDKVRRDLLRLPGAAEDAGGHSSSSSS